MAKYEGAELLKCSFCGKSQKQVKKLIAGPGVYICDECVDLCNEIIDEELTEPTVQAPEVEAPAVDPITALARPPIAKRQIEIARRVFSPEVDEVRWARRVIQEMGDGSGVVMIEAGRDQFLPRREMIP